MVDKIRESPGFLKGLTFELHVVSGRSGSSAAEPMMEMRIPKLPASLSRLVLRKQRMRRISSASTPPPTPTPLTSTLSVRRMSTPTAGFRGRTPIIPSRRHSSAPTAESAPSARTASPDPGRKRMLPFVKLDWQFKVTPGAAEHFPLCSYPASMTEKPENSRRPSSVHSTQFQPNLHRGKAVKIIYC